MSRTITLGVNGYELQLVISVSRWCWMAGCSSLFITSLHREVIARRLCGGVGSKRVKMGGSVCTALYRSLDLSVD